MLGTDFEKEFIERYIATHQHTQRQENTQQNTNRTRKNPGRQRTPISPDTPRLIVDLQNCIKAPLVNTLPISKYMMLTANRKTRQPSSQNTGQKSLCMKRQKNSLPLCKRMENYQT